MSAHPIDAMILSVARAAVEEERERHRQELTAIVADAVRVALETAQTDSVGGTDKLAEWVGCKTPTAAKRRADRDPELRSLAISGGGGKRWMWRHSDVLALMARRRAERGGR